MWQFMANWAAISVVLSGATQLRVPGLPIGPSELSLAVWLIFMGCLLIRGVKFVAGSVFMRLASYWALALVFLALGTLVAIQTREFQIDMASHDALAFIYAAALTCLMSLSLSCDPDREYHLQLSRTLFLFTALTTLLLLTMAHVSDQLGPISLWYFGVRFRGWSENPNQMALTLVAMPFLGWYVLNQAEGVARKVLYALAIALCMIAGWTTESDGLRVSWAVTLACLGSLLWFRMVVRGRGRWLYVSHVLVPALVVVVALFTVEGLLSLIGELIEGVYDEQDQGSVRVILWTHALEAIGYSPLVGFGPGRFSGVDGPFLRDEAHSSLLDWGMSTGSLGIVLHLALWARCAWRAIKSGSLPLLGIVLSIVILAQFHYSLRQPIYWTVLLLAVRLAERHPAPAVRADIATPTPLLTPSRRALGPQPGTASARAGRPPSVAGAGQPWIAANTGRSTTHPASFERLEAAGSGQVLRSQGAQSANGSSTRAVTAAPTSVQRRADHRRPR